VCVWQTDSVMNLLRAGFVKKEVQIEASLILILCLLASVGIALLTKIRDKNIKLTLSP